MKFPLRQFLLVPVVVLCAREAGAQTSAAAVDTQAQVTPAPSPDQEPEPSAPLDSFQLVKEGRALLKERKNEAGVAKLKDAVALGEAERRPGDEQALLHYLYSLALRKIDGEKEALAQIRRAVVLAPSEADYRLDLAQQLFERDEFEDAKREAEKALQLGLSDSDDQKDAQKLIKNAKSELLHQRFSFDASVSIGYDSNVLQGKRAETIGLKNTASSSATTAQRPRARLATLIQENAPEITKKIATNYSDVVRNSYLQPKQPESEWDLPVTLSLDIGGRLAAGKTVELWAGYRVSQTMMMSIAYDHDAYATQDHYVTLRVNWHPRSWIYIRPRIDGFINFSGLQSFEPFQGGVQGALDLIFIESARWRTRISYQHQYRASIDRNDAYLDGNRDDARITQELRLRGSAVEARGQLSYRFRSDRTGTLTSPIPFLPPLIYIPIGSDPKLEQIGAYSYTAPLSYSGHEISTRWRLLLPAKVEIVLGLGLEHRSYSDLYTASYSHDPYRSTTRQSAPAVIASECKIDKNCTLGQAESVTLSLPGATQLPGEQRIDNLISADIGITKNLPLGFSLDLSYSLLRNFSSIANGLDTRSYIKHTVVLTTSYSF